MTHLLKNHKKARSVCLLSTQIKIEVNRGFQSAAYGKTDFFESIPDKTLETLVFLPSDPNETIENRALISEKNYQTHMQSTFFALKAIRNWPSPSESAIQDKQLTLLRPIGYEQRKTLIFDLDETLVHCVGNNPGDISLPIRFPTGKTLITGVNIRPFAIECLLEASKRFEVIVFTASQQCYADVVLDYLDPLHTLIHHRLYREHCLKVNNFNVKDLRIFNNRNIQDISIIDNSVFSFAFHLDNGVPIVSWYDDKNDKELIELIEYFQVIDEAEDVREINRQIFHLETFYEDFLEDFRKK